MNSEISAKAIAPLVSTSDREPEVVHRVTLSRDLDEGPIHLWLTEKIEILAFKEDGEVRVVNAVCPHMGAQLTYVAVNRCVTCPWHGLKFETSSMKSDHHRYRKLSEFRAELKGKELFIFGRGTQ